jgi:hypothetical protein
LDVPFYSCSIISLTTVHNNTKHTLSIVASQDSLLDLNIMGNRVFKVNSHFLFLFLISLGPQVEYKLAIVNFRIKHKMFAFIRLYFTLSTMLKKSCFVLYLIHFPSFSHFDQRLLVSGPRFPNRARIQNFQLFPWSILDLSFAPAVDMRSHEPDGPSPDKPSIFLHAKAEP